MKLQEMSWTDVRSYLEKNRTIIIPLGAVEQHGAALPLGTDVIIAEGLAEEVGRRTNRLVGPALSPGISLTPHMNFPGTISFMPETYTRMIAEYITCLHHHGFRTFMMINGHGGNDGAIKNAQTEVRYKLDDIKIWHNNWWHIKEVIEKSIQLVGRSEGHGGAQETSLVWHLAQELVHPDRFARDMDMSPFLVSNNLVEKYHTKTGLMNADQSQASRELGRIVFENVVAKYVDMINEMESA